MRQFIRRLHAWPASKNPNAYEIFGMTPSTFSKSKLKATYIEMAKIYHPDKDQGSPAKFKLLTEAYNILRNDSKRRLYGTGTAGAAGSPSRPYDMGYRPQYNQYNRQHQQNQDPYDPDLDMNAGDERFRASLQESRYFILKVVVSVFLLVGVMEVTALFKASDKRIEHMENLSQRAFAAETLAFNNYHKGSSAQERVDRFLAQREYTLQRANGSFRYGDISAGQKGKDDEFPSVH